MQAADSNPGTRSMWPHRTEVARNLAPTCDSAICVSSSSSVSPLGFPWAMWLTGSAEFEILRGKSVRWPRWGLGKWNIPRGLLPCWSTHQQCGPGAKPRVKVKELSAAQNLKHVFLVKGSLLLRSTFFQSPLDQNLVGFGERGRSKSMRKGLNCARICCFFPFHYAINMECKIGTK